VTANDTDEQTRLLRNSRYLSAGSASLYLQCPTDNLVSKLPTQTHQLHFSAFKNVIFRDSNTFTLCGKTAVVLKLSNIIFAHFLNSTPKIECL